ncbi:MAG: hypothetical protein DLM60_23520 [Pseudonocardiales bacterium]|nr:MAG: hypothetical protein DLM60_23520 [Pseudonocardiales bacterium]
MPALDLDSAHWRKSTRSTDVANCVEVAFASSVVALRDSKNPAGGVLAIPPHRTALPTLNLPNSTGELSWWPWNSAPVEFGGWSASWRRWGPALAQLQDLLGSSW